MKFPVFRFQIWYSRCRGGYSCISLCFLPPAAATKLFILHVVMQRINIFVFSFPDPTITPVGTSLVVSQSLSDAVNLLNERVAFFLLKVYRDGVSSKLGSLDEQ